MLNESAKFNGEGECLGKFAREDESDRGLDFA